MPPQSIGSPPYVPLQQDAMHYLARVLQAVADAQHAQKMVDALTLLSYGRGYECYDWWLMVMKSGWWLTVANSDDGEINGDFYGMKHSINGVLGQYL